MNSASPRHRESAINARSPARSDVLQNDEAFNLVKSRMLTWGNLMRNHEVDFDRVWLLAGLMMRELQEKRRQKRRSWGGIFSENGE